jgi:hypothetical protein
VAVEPQSDAAVYQGRLPALDGPVYRVWYLYAPTRVRALPAADGLATHELGLADLGKAAAQVIATKGWIQGRIRDTEGRVCLHGALRAVTRERHPGDAPLMTAIFRARGASESWNDALDRTQAEVLAALEAQPVTDAECEKLMGPQWVYLAHALRQVHELREVATSPVAGHPCMGWLARCSPDERLEMYLSRLRLAIGATGENPMARQEVDRRWSAARSVSQLVHSPALAHTALAGWNVLAAQTLSLALIGLSLRDLLIPDVGTLRVPGAVPVLNGAAVYDALTGPYRAVLGPLHPCDPPVVNVEEREAAAYPLDLDLEPLLPRLAPIRVASAGAPTIGAYTNAPPTGHALDALNWSVMTMAVSSTGFTVFPGNIA